MKKKVILFIFIGIIIGSIVGIKAVTTIQSSQVLYKDKTLDTALNEMYDELYVGKEKLATSITNNGIVTNSETSFEDMATNINTLATNKYEEGVTYADGRLNTSSVSYTNGYDDGYSNGQNSITLKTVTKTSSPTAYSATVDFSTEFEKVVAVTKIVSSKQGDYVSQLVTVNMENRTVTINSGLNGTAWCTFTVTAMGY